MCNLQGSFVPFAATKRERLAIGDPRPSIEERYPNPEEYQRMFKTAADSLVARRFLRPDDAALLMERNSAGGIRSAP